MKTRIGIFFILVMLQACIGVDYIDDPVIGARIEISTTQTALSPGQTISLMAAYYNEYGIMENVPVMWISSIPLVATVDDEGVVTANGNGQAIVRANFMNIESNEVQVNVVSGPDDVAVVEVTAERTQLAIGEMITLNAVVKNLDGDVLDRPVEWFSDSPHILSVNTTTGEVMGITNGLGEVHAKSEGVKSNSILFVIGTIRMGTFVNSGGYMTSGTATLKQEGNDVILQLSDDFKTSFALGTYVYLSNVTSGSGVLANGVEIMQISENGAHTYNITSLHPAIGLYDYRYVIMLCKPAAVTFGYADMN